MKNIYKLTLFVGACAAIVSTVLLVGFLNKIADATDEEEEPVKEEEDKGLMDLENLIFKQN